MYIPCISRRVDEGQSTSTKVCLLRGNCARKPAGHSILRNARNQDAEWKTSLWKQAWWEDCQPLLGFTTFRMHLHIAIQATFHVAKWYLANEHRRGSYATIPNLSLLCAMKQLACYKHLIIHDRSRNKILEILICLLPLLKAVLLSLLRSLCQQNTWKPELTARYNFCLAARKTQCSEHKDVCRCTYRVSPTESMQDKALGQRCVCCSEIVRESPQDFQLLETLVIMKQSEMSRCEKGVERALSAIVGIHHV